MNNGVFNFGKHKSKTFKEVVEGDQSYTQWALSLPKPTGQLKTFVDYVKDIPGHTNAPPTQTNTSSKPVGSHDTPTHPTRSTSTHTHPPLEGLHTHPQLDGLYTNPQSDGLYTHPQLDGLHTHPQLDGLHTHPQLDGLHTHPQLDGLHTHPQLDGLHTHLQSDGLHTHPQLDGLHTHPPLEDLHTHLEGLDTRPKLEGLSSHSKFEDLHTQFELNSVHNQKNLFGESNYPIHTSSAKIQSPIKNTHTHEIKNEYNQPKVGHYNTHTPKKRSLPSDLDIDLIDDFLPNFDSFPNFDTHTVKSNGDNHIHTSTNIVNGYKPNYNTTHTSVNSSAHTLPSSTNNFNGHDPSHIHTPLNSQDNLDLPISSPMAKKIRANSHNNNTPTHTLTQTTLNAHLRPTLHTINSSIPSKQKQSTLHTPHSTHTHPYTSPPSHTTQSTHIPPHPSNSTHTTPPQHPPHPSHSTHTHTPQHLTHTPQHPTHTPQHPTHTPQNPPNSTHTPQNPPNSTHTPNTPSHPTHTPHTSPPQPSTTHTHTKSKEKLDYNISLELINFDVFRVISQKLTPNKKFSNQRWTTLLPKPLWEGLIKLKPSKIPHTTHTHTHTNNSAIRFTADRYKEVCEFIKLHFDCKFEKIPNFILRSFSPFSKEASPLTLPKKTTQILMGEMSPDTLSKKTTIKQQIGEELYEQLKPFQFEGIDFGLSKNGRVLIGDEMGLGKTLQALAIAAYYSSDWPLLIVCPSSIRFQWREQALRWLPHLLQSWQIFIVKNGKSQIPYYAQFVIISYDLLTVNERFQKSYKFVICDESHYLKNVQAKRTQVLTPIVKQARRAILLSGTPALNKPIELYQQLAVLLPDFGSYQDFAHRYCEQQMNWYTKKVEFLGSKHIEELHYFLTHTIMIRRLKKDVQKELPPKLRSRIPVEVSTKEMEEIKIKMSEVGGKFGAEEDGDSSIKRGVSQTLVGELFTLTGRAKIKGAIDYISYMINSNTKFLVFAHHLEMMNALENQVQKDKAGYIRIDGATPGEKRQNFIKKFQEQDECRVAILSITACATGLNLTAAGTVVFAELYWVPGLIIQAEDRCHRIGTEYSSINVHYLIAEDTLDDNVWKTLIKKWSVMTSTLDGTAQQLDAAQLSKGDRPLSFFLPNKTV